MIPDKTADGAMNVLRGWRNDGADGESAHLVCKYVEQLRARLTLAEGVVEAAREVSAAQASVDAARPNWSGEQMFRLGNAGTMLESALAALDAAVTEKT